MNKTKHLARYFSFELNLTSDKNKLQSWRNGPAVTITWFSCRGLGFGSQHPHCSLQPFITLPRPCWDYPLLCISDCQSPAGPARQWHKEPRQEDPDFEASLNFLSRPCHESWASSSGVGHWPGAHKALVSIPSTQTHTG